MAISLSGQSADDHIHGSGVPSRRRRFRRILYRSLGLATILAGFLSSARLTAAQEEVPEVTPRAKTPTKKSGQGPRALGLLQLASNGKASLIPIAIRVNGKFYDAAAYKATPVPMALDSGTVYEGERTGKSVGLFTLNGALHSQAANAASSWIGTGMWLPTGSDAPKTGLKAERVPLGIETTDEPPRLTKGGSAPKDAPPAGAASPSTAPQSTSGPAAGSNPTPPPQPGLGSANHPQVNADDKTAKAGKQESAGSGQQNPDPPADHNRPRLRRGKPSQPAPPDEEAASLKGPIQLVPAISDAEGPDPRSFAFEWSQGEEEDRRKQMLVLAKEQLRSYLVGREKNSTKASAPKPTPGGRKLAVKAPEPVFDNVQMRTFDLWGNNQPVLILSAEAHVPAAGATAGATKGAPTPSTADGTAQYSITLAARVDIYGNLRKLYSGVTDKYHLDVTPRLELIDAVDADGDGRGELLFRETTDSGGGYIIYRATADTLWKMFDSLNQE